MISIIEAIENAKSVIQKSAGLDADPDMVRLIDRDGKKRWWVIYDAYHFFKEELDNGAVVDGGECIISVDFQTGEVSIEG